MLGICAGLALTAAVSADAELVRNPTQVGANVDVGQIVKGDLYVGTSPQGEIENEIITRTGVYLTESGVYDDRLTIKLTIGGLFWFASAAPSNTDFQNRRVQFGPGVGQAQAVYAFGEDPKKPTSTLQFGLFSHKYSDAVNLGEYMYRTGTYPGLLYSGGWSYMNASGYLAQGVRWTMPTMGGLLTHDVTAYMERGLQPLHDITPGYMITVKPTPFFNASAGVVWSHAISLNSKRLSPKAEANAYSKRTNRPVKDAVASGGSVEDSITAYDWANKDSLGNIGYYTFKGFKVMGRAALDIGQLAGMESVKPGQFKVYTEVALLGVEDQPYYYEDKTARMPVMFGLNVPTFGLFDRLTFEGEYLASAFPNDNANVLQNQYPTPVSTPYAFDPDDKQFDDWKWTVYLSRKIVNGVTVYAQAASDHLRHFDNAAVPAARSATPTSKDWYYVLRLDFGI